MVPKRVQRRVEIGRVITFQLEQELRARVQEMASFIHSFEAVFFLLRGSLSVSQSVSQSVSRWRRVHSIRFTFRESTWAAAKKGTHCSLPHGH